MTGLVKGCGSHQVLYHSTITHDTISHEVLYHSAITYVLFLVCRIQQQNEKLSSTLFFVVRNSLVSMVTDACLSSCHVAIVTDITILYRTMSLTYLLYHPENEAEKTSLPPVDPFLLFTCSILCKT